MLIYGATEDQVRHAVQVASERYFAGNIVLRNGPYLKGRGFGIALGVLVDHRPGARVSRGRKSPFPCVHTHGRIAQVLFGIVPDARITMTRMGRNALGYVVDGKFCREDVGVLLPGAIEVYLKSLGSEVVPCYCTDYLLNLE